MLGEIHEFIALAYRKSALYTIRELPDSVIYTAQSRELNQSGMTSVLTPSSTESRFSGIRAALRFATLAIRLDREGRRRWSLRRNRVKRVLRTM